MAISKGAVDRAGARLRDAWNSDFEEPWEGLVEAYETVWEYRRQFQYPLTKVNANLRHYVKSAGSEVFIAQRLKRLPRILVKMARHPRMRLTQMQDVGGCRAILGDEAAVRHVLDGIQRNWDVITVDDYIKNPKPDGYRAVHVITRRSEVPIEVQLRTAGQQDWADEVERIDGLMPNAVKDGEGPPEVVEYLKALAELIDAVEGGTPVDPALSSEFLRLRRLVP